ncbi:hypothetical protein PHY01_43620 [Pseudonocardia hydrocarbonoxydans]|uniref:DUF1707 domain-containing protein n=1 Tax=Pseudonocardia hydrocarbonoxydans TaxID=76726 RepID=A0A4Y3WWH0_9PSEU|nr:hypothetical protein PHY01_43620 [Pseudonocardia hydrocarbonoxydans]
MGIAGQATRARSDGPRRTILDGVTVQPPDKPGFRISDADRERAATRLHHALAEGRITVSELEERLTVVYAARYEADLVPPLADLPGPEVAPVAAVPSTPSGPPVVLRAGMSTIKRTGDWDVPARLRLQSSMGTIVLDFCDATIHHPVVEVEVDVGAGSVRLLVPDDATANVDDVASSMGTVRSKVPSRPRPGAVHFVVHGRTGMGSVTVRRRYQVGGLKF